jgi:hypothetical protein
MRLRLLRVTRHAFRVATLLLLIPLALPGRAAAQEEKKNYPRNVITREEIQDRAPDAKTALDVVQRLRPQFLRTRPSGSGQSRNVPVKVYVDGSARASTASLREIQSTAIVEIVYLDGRDATMEFGREHENGAIKVKTGS